MSAAVFVEAAKLNATRHVTCWMWDKNSAKPVFQPYICSSKAFSGILINKTRHLQVGAGLSK